MKVNKTPVATAAALVLLSISLGAQAQAQSKAASATEANDGKQLEQVVVTGIRASMQSAANIKKAANAVVDAVTAEDVGKLPDADVGQALGRIPGISVGRDFGVGASVSIRGTDPQMTYTTLNGQTVASTGWYDQKDTDRSFNYSLLPPELIGGMEVYKSSQADLTEGGIGGTVIVKTRKPLDLAPNTIYGGVKLGKGGISKDWNKDVSGLYSWRNAGKTFGVLVAAGIENGNYVRKGVEADMRWSGDVAPSTFVQDRKRTALNVSLQARPTQNIDLGLTYTRLALDANNSNTSHYIFSGNGDATDCKKTNPVNGLCVLNTRTTADPTKHNVFLQNWVRSASMNSNSLVLDGAFKGDGFKLTTALGTTKAEGGTDQTANFAYGQWAEPGAKLGTLPIWTGTIDATGSKIVLSPASNQNVGVSNLPAKSAPELWANGRGPNKDRESFMQLDGSVDLNLGVLTSFKTGIRSTDHTFTRQAFRGLQPTAANVKSFDTAGLYSGSIDMVGGWSLPQPNIDAMLSAARANVLGWVEDRSAYAELNEKNSAMYGMFDFDADKVHGNFGLRYVHTRATSTGYAFDGSKWSGSEQTDAKQNNGWGKEKTSRSASYSDFLPSLNVAVDVQRNTILRFAAAQAITRPNFANMFNTTVVGFDDQNTANDAFNYGTPTLKPQKSTQFDLGLEYYYGRGNLVSAAIFYKKINNFITTQTATNQKVGVVSPDTGVDSWTINRFVNAGGGSIKGLELQANHAFSNGFGVAANYTFSDATAPAKSYQDELNQFTLSSKHNTNLVGYYENDSYSARLAYNWRSKYMVRESGWYGNRMHDSTGSLDLSLGWNVAKGLRLSLDAVNLLKQDDVQYGAAGAASTVRPSLKGGFPTWYFEGETTYRIGLSAKF
ncbi:TonB-dependent receptor [Roseateles sp. BYS180W]|uniref:TonB-dependent receptor n=1 Tax=Roseateles rivi TaxID=3299028 RepID=A0ABW7FWB9_9BURK